MTATLYAGSSPPIKNQSYTIYFSVVSQSDTDIFQSNPTIATGDFKTHGDGGTPANTNSNPSAINSGKVLSLTLTAAEMNYNKVYVLGSDASGSEWQDILIVIYTVAATTVSSFDETATLPDSIAADGNRPTVNQALLMLTRFFWEKDVSSTTVTVYKEDGSTSNMTFTLDNADNPTTITRAS